MELKEIELGDEQLTEKKLDLMNAEIQKDETDLSLKEMEEQLDAQIPNKLFQDEVKKIKKIMKDGKTEEGIELEEGEKEMLKIRLKYIQKTLDKDLPLRKLRLKILGLKYSKNRIDAPEQQISKLKREIREKKATVPASRVRNGIPTGVG
jgi:hypothetical protein